MSPLDRIQKAAMYGSIVLSSHFRDDRMVQRNVYVRDIKAAIRSATSAEAQEGGAYRLVGLDCSGESLTVIVREIQPGLFVITAY